jgi:uncharacterized protein
VTEFTPWSAALGGVLIGSAAALLLLAQGRIAGVAGILRGVLWSLRGDTAWRVAFVAGLPLGAALVGWARGGLAIEIAASAPQLALAGVLVGFGTQLGSGCTSGHGVCGLARGARRSLLATATFMVSGAATVYVVRHVLGG